MGRHNIKKMIVVLIMCIVTLNNLILSSVVLADDEIVVKIDGKKIDFDLSPQIIDERTMVPMRKIFEQLGLEVNWNEEGQIITAKNTLSEVAMAINYELMYVNGTPKLLDVTPKLIDGKTLVPLRAISEALGANVNWRSSTQTVEIQSLENYVASKFVEGCEKASKDKIEYYNIYEGYQTYRKLYMNCYINDVKVRNIGDSKYDSVIMANVTDNTNSKWNLILSPLNADESNKNEFDDFVGKSVTVIGNYYSTLADIKDPIILSRKMIDVSSAHIIYDSETNSDHPNVSKGTTQRMYAVSGATLQTTSDKAYILEKLCWYTEPKIAMFSEDGGISIISEKDKNEYENKGWFNELIPSIMYTDDNKIHFVKEENVNARKTDGWHSHPVVKMYAVDGRTMLVEECDIESYKNVGWFMTPATTMYAPDGRTIDVEQSQVEDYLNVGWSITPMITMYAPDGRELVIEQSQVSEYENVGWYTKPVQYVYAPDGRTELIPCSDVDSWVNVGWYTELFIGKPYVYNFKDVPPALLYDYGIEFELRWDPVKSAIGYEIEIKSADGYGSGVTQHYEIVNAEDELKYCTGSCDVYDEKVRIRAFGINMLGKTVYGEWSDVRQLNLQKYLNYNDFTFRFDLLEWNHLYEVKEALGVPNDNTIYTRVYKPYFIDNRYVIEVEFEKYLQRSSILLRALCDHYTGEILDISSNL